MSDTPSLPACPQCGDEGSLYLHYEIVKRFDPVVVNKDGTWGVMPGKFLTSWEGYVLTCITCNWFAEDGERVRLDDETELDFLGDSSPPKD